MSLKKYWQNTFTYSPWFLTQREKLIQTKCWKKGKNLTKWMTGAGHVCLISSVQESWYTQRELAAPPHQTQPYLGSAVRHRLQSDRPTEQLNRVTEAREKKVNRGKFCSSCEINTLYSTVVIYNCSHTHHTHTLLSKPTIQILSTFNEEVVFSPHIDCGWVFLQRDRVRIL